MSHEYGPDVETLKACIDAAFGTDAGPPAMSLRAGNALDDHATPLSWDAALDTADVAYLECNFWGLSHLDPASWRHYLPIFMRHALNHIETGATSSAVDALLFSLDSPDASRLGSLSPAQQAAVSQFLDVLALHPRSLWADEATTALAWYWAPGAIYR